MIYGMHFGTAAEATNRLSLNQLVAASWPRLAHDPMMMKMTPTNTIMMMMMMTTITTITTKAFVAPILASQFDYVTQAGASTRLKERAILHPILNDQQHLALSTIWRSNTQRLAERRFHGLNESSKLSSSKMTLAISTSRSVSRWCLQYSFDRPFAYLHAY